MFKLGESMENLKIDFKEFILDNGLKIIILKRDCKFFNLNFGIKIGSAYEFDNERGFSHFIEHMLFRSNLKFSNYEVNKILEFLGGDYDAFTDYGSTIFTIRGLCCDLEKSIELISSMVRYPKFDDKEMYIERDVIISEIESCIADYEEYSFIKLNEESFENSHLKYDIAGTKETIKNIVSEDLRRFYEKYYVSNNSFMVVISSYDESYVINLLKKYFDSWQSKELLHKKLIEESNIPKKIVTEKKDLELSTVTYLFTFNNLLQHEKIFLKIAEYKLGGGSNSILFKRVREENGLAYDIYTQLELSDEFKGMYIFCATNDQNVDEVIKIIDSCIEDIKNCKNYFDDYSLQLIKKLQLMSIYSTLEDNEKLGLYLLEKIIYKKNINDYLDDLSMIEKVSSEELMNVCKKYFNNPTIHILKGK